MRMIKGTIVGLGSTENWFEIDTQIKSANKKQYVTVRYANNFDFNGKPPSIGKKIKIMVRDDMLLTRYEVIS